MDSEVKCCQLARDPSSLSRFHCSSTTLQMRVGLLALVPFLEQKIIFFQRAAVIWFGSFLFGSLSRACLRQHTMGWGIAMIDGALVGVQTGDRWLRLRVWLKRSQAM